MVEACIEVGMKERDLVGMLSSLLGLLICNAFQEMQKHQSLSAMTN
jgi:hypothetical protein